jgi:hypothetical protein
MATAPRRQGGVYYVMKRKRPNKIFFRPNLQVWSDKYPCDSEIVMNIFAAYLDNCMPPNYSSQDGKPFTNTYFVRAADKSDAKVFVQAGDRTLLLLIFVRFHKTPAL